MINPSSASDAREAPGRPGIAFAVRRALVLLLLACLLVQGTAVQTHVHFTQATRAAASAGSGIQVAKAGNGSDAADCPLCQEAAMAGAYLLPPAISLPPAPAPFLWFGIATIGEFDLLTPALGWLSRAPPQ